jgi:hypothetical protein
MTLKILYYRFSTTVNTIIKSEPIFDSWNFLLQIVQTIIIALTMGYSSPTSRRALVGMRGRFKGAMACHFNTILRGP